MFTRSTNVDSVHTVNNQVEKSHKIGERFREVRRILGLTQQQLAERLFLTRNYVAKIETGAKEPSVRSIRALESLLVSSEYKQAEAGVHEDQESTDTLVAEIRHFLEAAIAGAAGDKRKLAWILEQLRRHVSPAEHWRGKDGPLVRVNLPSQSARPAPSASPRTQTG